MRVDNLKRGGFEIVFCGAIEKKRKGGVFDNGLKTHEKKEKS